MCRVAVQASSLPGASATWELHGAKLCGGFTLVRSGRRSADPAGEEQGLLTKHGDECADPAWVLKIGASIAPSSQGRSMKKIERAGSDTVPRRRLASGNQVKG